MSIPLILLTVLLLAIVGAFWFFIFVYRKDEEVASETAPSPRPPIVIQLPSDWKPLEAATPGGQTLDGARAVLYWTVYKHTFDSLRGDGEEITDLATHAADRAVATAFPSPS